MLSRSVLGSASHRRFPWLRFDFEKEYVIYEIELFVRFDCCGMYILTMQATMWYYMIHVWLTKEIWFFFIRTKKRKCRCAMSKSFNPIHYCKPINMIFHFYMIFWTYDCQKIEKRCMVVNLYPLYDIVLYYHMYYVYVYIIWIAANEQWVRASAQLTEGWMFESQPRRT